MGSEEPSLRGIADMRKRCTSVPPGESRHSSVEGVAGTSAAVVKPELG